MIEIRPVAARAQMKRRHWGLLTSFLFLVLAPLVVAGYYLWFVSVDQYASTTGFTVRQEESGSATDLLGGLAGFAAGGSSDSDVLYEFIQSQDLVASIESRVGLVQMYSEPWPQDPLFALWPDANIEDLLWYWLRVVRIAYDQSTGLIEVRVLAFSAEDAQAVAKEIVAASQQAINDLNAAARADMLRYAKIDLDAALDRLKAAREAMTRFRVRTQIVDPSADLQGQAGVVNNLQQQLAESLIEFDLLSETIGENDPRIRQASRKIEVIRARISEERAAFTSGEVGGKDYPTLMAEYESLLVDREFAEQTYRAALAAQEIARANVARQSRYLATYIRPTLAQSSEYPQRYVLIALAALFLTLAWAILALIYYSIRDRR